MISACSLVVRSDYYVCIAVTTTDRLHQSKTHVLIDAYRETINKSLTTRTNSEFSLSLFGCVTPMFPYFPLQRDLRAHVRSKQQLLAPTAISRYHNCTSLTKRSRLHWVGVYFYDYLDKSNRTRRPLRWSTVESFTIRQLLLM